MKLRCSRREFAGLLSACTEKFLVSSGELLMARFDIVLPRLCGTRMSANRLVSQILGDTTGAEVTVRGDELTACTGGYVDELVRELCEIRACSVVFGGFDTDQDDYFMRFLERQVAARGIGGLVAVSG